MRIVLYARVSTDEQATEGVSLAAQRERLEAYAKLYGHEVVAYIEDAGVSAKDLKRPGLKRALKLLRDRTADGLLVTKIDRLTRRLGDLSQLVEKYFSAWSSLLSVAESIDTSSAAGRAMLHMIGVFAAWERETIVERTREALRHKRDRGARLGAVPLGYQRAGDSFVEDPVEQAVIARAKALHGEGKSLREIARQLDAEGCKTKRGGVWRACTVANLLTTEKTG